MSEDRVYGCLMVSLGFTIVTMATAALIMAVVAYLMVAP